MNPFTKFEAIGIFLSIVVMALALSATRFGTGTFAKISTDGKSNVASVVATTKDDTTGVENALKDSVGLDGELKKLVIDDVRIGTGKEVAKGDTVTVNYKGTLKDGTQFDSSYVRGEPFTFTLGEGKVIKGWEEGLVGMKVGGERILVIPSDMAYGNRQVGPIPANSPLIFSVELISIK